MSYPVCARAVCVVRLLPTIKQQAHMHQLICIRYYYGDQRSSRGGNCATVCAPTQNKAIDDTFTHTTLLPRGQWMNTFVLFKMTGRKNCLLVTAQRILNDNDKSFLECGARYVPRWCCAWHRAWGDADDMCVLTKINLFACVSQFLTILTGFLTTTKKQFSLKHIVVVCQLIILYEWP